MSETSEPYESIAEMHAAIQENFNDFEKSLEETERTIERLEKSPKPSKEQFAKALRLLAAAEDEES